MGPESRSQTRSVGQWWKWRRARLAPARVEDGGGAALGGAIVDEDVDVFDAARGGGRSRRRPRGWAGTCPGQSSGLCGQAIQVAACGAHSAGMR